jgi:hypothetical protein
VVGGLTALTMGSSDSLKVGDLVVAIGNALDLQGSPTLAEGIVSRLDRTITTQEATLNGLIQTSAGISSGDSGGPLLTPDGQVVGINDAAAAGNEETRRPEHRLRHSVHRAGKGVQPHAVRCRLGSRAACPRKAGYASVLGQPERSRTAAFDVGHTAGRDHGLSQVG